MKKSWILKLLPYFVASHALDHLTRMVCKFTVKQKQQLSTTAINSKNCTWNEHENAIVVSISYTNINYQM